MGEGNEAAQINVRKYYLQRTIRMVRGEQRDHTHTVLETKANSGPLIANHTGTASTGRRARSLGAQQYKYKQTYHPPFFLLVQSNVDLPQPTTMFAP